MLGKVKDKTILSLLCEEDVKSQEQGLQHMPEKFNKKTKEKFCQCKPEFAVFSH